jgi:uncharacterized protein DUF2188
MATKRVVYSVEPRPNGEWATQRRGSERAASVSENKSQAISEARRLAQQHPLSQVVIKAENGRVEREYTYGADPSQRRG